MQGFSWIERHETSEGRTRRVRLARHGPPGEIDRTDGLAQAGGGRRHGEPRPAPRRHRHSAHRPVSPGNINAPACWPPCARRHVRMSLPAARSAAASAAASARRRRPWSSGYLPCIERPGSDSLARGRPCPSSEPAPPSRSPMRCVPRSRTARSGSASRCPQTPNSPRASASARRRPPRPGRCSSRSDSSRRVQAPRAPCAPSARHRSLPARTCGAHAAPAGSIPKATTSASSAPASSLPPRRSPRSWKRSRARR
jgi:hypothetical protein